MRTLYAPVSEREWERAVRRGALGISAEDADVRGEAAAPMAVTFLTEHPDAKHWFRKIDVIVTVVVPDGMVRPWSEFNLLMSTSEQMKETASRLESKGDPSSWYVVPRLIPHRYWRMAMSVKREVLWLPVAA